MYVYPFFSKLGLTTGFLATMLYLYQWQSPKIDLQLRPTNEQSWHEMIHTNQKSKHTTVTSLENEFDIFYVENIQPNDPYAFAPYFPAIEISTKTTHAAWLQIVRTDSQDPDLKIFIDSCPQNYPFYTQGQNFYDLPSWNYTFLTKPLTSWIAHAYAIKINELNKTIQCIGGISWGFRFNQFSFKPIMILPNTLDTNDWQSDWKLYQEALPDYQDITA